ncbi:MAG: serine/threonine-protein phosphatase [Actinobacteria bacterium]|nr:serine/threonine-protein phosphatase [Actinomycetota bacterium]
MADPTDVRSDLRALLDAVEAAPPMDAVDVLARELARMVDAVDISFLIADFSGDAVHRFMPDSTGAAAPGQNHHRDHMATVPLAGSPYGRALRSQQVCVEDHGDMTRLYAPVTDRGDALGVLELALPSPPDDDMVTFIASAAHALAYVIIANRRHTDLFERGQRNTPFSLAAEIQRRLLPAAFTCEGAEFTVAGWLEPASEVGGDTFDYSVERYLLHVSISDAKGHTVNAAQLATLAVSSLRNSRRSQSSVVDQARAANATIAMHATDEDYVAAIVMSVDLLTGVVEVVNAGHPTPHLVRNGVATELELRADLPFGMFADAEYRAQALVLEPGDRLVLVTDGMLERNSSALDIAVALTEMTALHPREVVHTFARAVLAATGGDLQDDATVLCLDWYGPQGSGGGRVASAGATQSRASGPPSADEE